MVTLRQRVPTFQGSGYKGSERKKPFLYRGSKSSLVSKTATKKRSVIVSYMLDCRQEAAQILSENSIISVCFQLS